MLLRFIGEERLVFSRAGLVTGERQSRSIIYRANLARLREDCGGRPEVCAPLVADLAPCCSPKALVHD